MSGRSTRPRAKVDYARTNFRGTPQWLRAEDRGSDEDDSDSPEPAVNESQRDAKRKSAPQSKAGHKPAKTAKRTSAPADTGRDAANKKPAAAVVSKQIEFKAEDEAPGTALPLSKRLEKHKRPRSSDEDEDAAEAVEQAPAKQKKQDRPASAPSGKPSKHEDSAAEQAAQTKPRGRGRKSAPAANGSQAIVAAAPEAEGKAAAHPVAKHSISKAGQQEEDVRDEVPGALNKSKQQKQKAKKGQSGAPTDAAVSHKTAADKQTSGSSKGTADTKAKSKSVGSSQGHSHDGNQLEEPIAAAAAAGKAKQKASGSSKSTAKQATNPPAAAAATSARSGASKKGAKSAATKAAAATADEPESAAGRAAAPSKKSKSKASSAAAAAAAAAETAAAAESLPGAADAQQQQQTQPPAADRTKADKRLPAAPPTPAGTEVTAVNDNAVAAAPAAAAGTSGGSGLSEFAKLQAEYRRLYAMYDELKTQKIQVMEGLVQEQDDYIVKMGEEARQLVDHWRKEAEQQRHTAASIKAPETARHIKQLQDNAIADKAALLEKDRALLKLQAEVAELKQKLLEAGARPEVVDAAVQVAPELMEVSLDPLTAETAAAAALAAAAAAAQQTPAPPGKQFAACQFPTPAVPVLPSPGVGMQFPSPAAAAGGSSGEAAAASIGSDLTDAAAAAAATGGGPGSATDGDAAAAAAALECAGQVPYNTPGGINASMFPANSDAAAAAAAARQAEVAAAAQQPLPVSSDSGAAGTVATDPSTVRKQLQLSESKSQGGGSSPVRGLVINGTAAKGGIARSTAAQDRVAPAPKPYNTPGGINAFMFNAATATGTTSALAVAGRGAGESVVGFAFRNETNAAATNGNSVSLGAALQQQPQQQAEVQMGMFDGNTLAEAAMGSGGNDAAGGGSGGVQNSDHGSVIVDNRQQLRGPMLLQGLGMQNNIWRAGAGLLTPPIPAAPHCTPVGLGRSPAAAAAAAGSVAAAMMRQQQQLQGTPASTGSLQRVQMRNKQLAELRAALQQGVSPMCGRGGLAAAAAAERADDAAVAAAAAAGGGGDAAAAAAAAGTPVAAPAAVRRVAGVSPGRLAFSPMAVGHTPACTPASTPAALAAATQRLPLDKLTAALAAAAATAATPGEPSPAAAAAAPPAAAAAADDDDDVDVGFAGFFSPPLAAAAAKDPAVADNGLQAAAAGVEATPQSGVVLPAVGTSDRLQTGRRARISPQRLNSTGGRRRSASASKHLMPLTYLCDFDPQLLDHGNIQYKHNATGFTFRLGPALSNLTAPTPMTAQTSDAAWNDEDDNDDTDDGGGGDSGDYEWEEEISFVPVAMGAAETTLPEFLKEPITFAPAAKPQFMKLLFQALAEATKAAAAAAAEQQQRGGRAARNRRSSRHQQKQQQEAAAAAAAAAAADGHDADLAAGVEGHADKENAAARKAAVAAGRKSNAAANAAAAAVVGGHRQ